MKKANKKMMTNKYWLRKQAKKRKQRKDLIIGSLMMSGIALGLYLVANMVY